MKRTKNATSLVEALIMMTILILGLTGVYNIYSKSNKLTISIEEKIQATQIARQGIEAITNIRDTNFLLFEANIDNCWKVLNYNNNCISDPLGGTYNIADGNYKVYRDINNRWILEQPGTALVDFTSSPYRNFYKVQKDSNGIYTQNGSANDFRPLFTRRIVITTVGGLGTVPGYGETFEGIKVSSIVNWSDEGGVREIKLETILTNHKK